MARTVGQPPGVKPRGRSVSMSDRVKHRKKVTADRKSSAAKRAKRSTKPDARRSPRARKKKVQPVRDEKGPLGWLIPDLESAYTPLVARGDIGAAAAAGSATIRSSLAPKAKTILAPVDSTI